MFHMKQSLIEGMILAFGFFLVCDYCRRVYNAGHAQGYIDAKRRNKLKDVIPFPEKKAPDNDNPKRLDE